LSNVWTNCVETTKVRHKQNSLALIPKLLGLRQAQSD
jgi:hypothetical protein